MIAAHRAVRQNQIVARRRTDRENFAVCAQVMPLVGALHHFNCKRADAYMGRSSQRCGARHWEDYSLSGVPSSPNGASCGEAAAAGCERLCCRSKTTVAASKLLDDCLLPLRRLRNPAPNLLIKRQDFKCLALTLGLQRRSGHVPGRSDPTDIDPMARL